MDHVNGLTPEYLIVGSGLTGATIARTLADTGCDVLVVDRRRQVGGNIADAVHETGIRVHTYGPHYFRTNSEAIWDFLNRFTSFHPYEAALQSLVDGRYERWPVTREYLLRAVGPDWSPSSAGEVHNFEEACLAMMPRIVYEKFVKGYTEKQWGIPARLLSKELAGRFDVREDDEPRLSRHGHQGIPRFGYSAMIEKMLDGIPLLLGFDYLQHRALCRPTRRLVYTGPIDEFFGFSLGRLQYRSQRRTHSFIADSAYVQPCGQVNTPDPASGPSIRTLEWKHMMPASEADRIAGTLLTTETPYSPEEPENYEYPFPDAANQNLYAQYRAMAEALPEVLICGRLGEYKYYDMDQAVARALLLARRLLESHPAAVELLGSLSR